MPATENGSIESIPSGIGKLSPGIVAMIVVVTIAGIGAVWLCIWAIKKRSEKSVDEEQPKT